MWRNEFKIKKRKRLKYGNIKYRINIALYLFNIYKEIYGKNISN